MESGGISFTFQFLIFSSQTFEKLKEEIQTHEIIEEAGIEQINVLLVGDVAWVFTYKINQDLYSLISFVTPRLRYFLMILETDLLLLHHLMLHFLIQIQNLLLNFDTS